MSTHMYFAKSRILQYHHSSMSILNLRKSLDQGAHEVATGEGYEYNS